MPNLVPPITTVEAALSYKARLQAIDSTVNYLMTLYLHKDITPEVVREAKKAGIVGIKSYPAGEYLFTSFVMIMRSSTHDPRFYPLFLYPRPCPSKKAMTLTQTPGVTTNSSSGVLSYEPFYPVFEAMQECGLVLNLHGECPSDKNITILNAEASFLPTLKSLHEKFPKYVF
jgi:dihydroorotase